MISSAQHRVIWASMLGNALELYDYTLYGYFAAILATQFFPTSDPLTGLLMTYGVYASGFLFRPLGALFFGIVGDRYGRKRALELSILMMAIPSLLIGLLPTYAQIGLLAPILLTILRLFQGLSVGGELVGSFTYLVEHAPAGRRGYFGSWTVIGGFGGKVAGTFVAGLISLFMSPAWLEAWGWRLPFILGLGFAAAGYWIRRYVEESPVFVAMKTNNEVESQPIKAALLTAPKYIVQGIGMVAIHSSCIHLIFIYFPVFLKTQASFSYPQALFATFFALLFSMAGMLLGGALSDRVGRLPVMLGGGLLVTALTLPLFWVLSSATLPWALTLHMTMAFLVGVTHGPFPAALNELFPAQIRYTASAISYNIGVCLFGGMAPFVATQLIALLEKPEAPAYWILFCGALSTASLLWIGETRERERFTALTH